MFLPKINASSRAFPFSFLLLSLAFLLAPAYGITVSACQNLNSSDTYTLNQSVSVSGATCFNVTAQNVTLDCGGFSISGNSATGTYGVYSTQFNTTVANCNVSSFQHAILFNASNNGTIRNNNVSSTHASGNGIYLVSSNYTNIANITAITTEDGAIWINADSYFNTLSESTLTTSGYQNALYVTGGNNVVNRLTISSTGTPPFGARGIGVWGNNNVIANSTVSTRGVSEAVGMDADYNSFYNITANATVSYGFNLGNSAFNNFTAVTAISGTSYGFFLQNGDNSIIANSTIRSGNNTVFYFDLTSSANLLVNNTLVSGNGAGMLVYHGANSSGNTFYWNNFSATTGLYVNDTNGSNFYNTTINGTAAGNIWANVIDGSVQAYGNASSPFAGLYYGSNGSGYPYNSSNSQGKVLGNVVDWGPLTSATGAPASVSVNPVSPANGYAANNSTGISFQFNFTSSASAAMNCTLFANNSTAIYRSDFNSTTQNNTLTTLTQQPFTANGNYTWYVNCLNASSGESNNSTARSFTIDGIAPAFTSVSVLEPDFFYSPFAGNDVINLNISVNGTGTNVSAVTAQLLNMSQAVWQQASLTYNSTTGLWNGSMNVSGNISTLKSTGAIGANSPVAGFSIILSATDAAGNNANDLTSLNMTLLHDLGSYQGPPAQFSTCFREGSGSTNMSQILNFNAVNFTSAAMINGSAECNNQTMGIYEQLPWGATFRTVGQITLYNVNMSTQEQAGQVMAAMGNLIRIQIAKPHSFGTSRIFVNTTGSYSYLNRSATIILYDLPFSSAPSVIYDGGAATINLSWSQGAYNSTFNSSLGNLTINVTGFSGYNVTDNSSPTISILQPAAGLNTTNASVVINVSANGTGSEISVLKINITSGGTQYNFTQYTNVTNTANCGQLAPGSENVTCQITVSLSANLTYTLNVTAFDYGGSSPGNSYSVQQNFTVDNAAPTLTLNSPASGANVSTTAPQFNWTASDALLTAITCNLSVDGSVNRSNISVTNGTAYNTTATSALSDGSHNWSVGCWDSLSNTVTSSTNSFTVDSTAPLVTINSPANASNSTASNVTFNFTASDALRLGINCNLTIDGSVNRSGLSVTNGTPYTTSATALFANGSHNWSVTCWDDLNNSNASATRIFSYLSQSLGNASSINTTGLGTLNVSINGSEATGGSTYTGALEVNVTSGGAVLLSFTHNFSVAAINLSALNLSNGTSSGASYFIVNGANSTGAQSGTKTIKIYGTSSSYNAVCVKNAENISVSNITSACSASDEVKVRCDGTATSGITCSASGTTLTISGLQYSGVIQYNIAAAASSTSSGSNSGGGSVGGGGSPSGGQASAYHLVDIGEGIFCNVSVSREISSSTNLSRVTTTLRNFGGGECIMSDFVFSDNIPPSLPPLEQISFEPAYSSLEGRVVSFVFPTFSPRESKTITYTVAGWVPPSRLQNFTIYSFLAAKQTVAAPEPPAKEETEPLPAIPQQRTPPKANLTGESAPAPPPAPQAQDYSGLTLLAVAAVVVFALLAAAAYALTRKKHR